MVFHRSDVRSKVREALVRGRANQEPRWDDWVRVPVFRGAAVRVYMYVMTRVYIGGMGIERKRDSSGVK